MEANVNATQWKEIARSDFGRVYTFGYALVTAITLRDEKSGEIRLQIEVTNAQMLRIPENLGELLQGIGFSIAALCSEHRVMVYHRRFLGVLERFDIWSSCCRVLNSLDHWLKTLD